MNIDLYRYYIGREDQSVNRENIVKRYRQQIRVMKEMLNAYSYRDLNKLQSGLSQYMKHDLGVVMTLTIKIAAGCFFVEIKKYISRIKVIKATIYFQKKFKKSLDTGEIPCYTLISYAGNPKQRDVFYMQVIEELSRALYKSMSRTDFIRFQNELLLKLGV